MLACLSRLELLVGELVAVPLREERFRLRGPPPIVIMNNNNNNNNNNNKHSSNDNNNNNNNMNNRGNTKNNDNSSGNGKKSDFVSVARTRSALLFYRLCRCSSSGFDLCQSKFG